MRAAPAALSAEELLEQVWDEHTDPFTKTVQVTIGRLRRSSGSRKSSRPSPGLATASLADTRINRSPGPAATRGSTRQRFLLWSSAFPSLGPNVNPLDTARRGN